MFKFLEEFFVICFLGNSEQEYLGVAGENEDDGSAGTDFQSSVK